MNFENITLGQVAVALTTVGVIVAFLFKVFSFFNRVKENEKEIESLKLQIKEVKEDSEKRNNEVLATVNKTNEAVNLLCSAISAMIDNELSENKNIDELENVKRQLDAKKGIV